MSQYLALEVTAAFAGYEEGAIITDPGTIDAILHSTSSSNVKGLTWLPKSTVSSAGTVGVNLSTTTARVTPINVENVPNTLTIVKLPIPVPVPVNLPPDPSEGDTHAVIDGTASAEGCPITVMGNGNPIEGDAVIKTNSGSLSLTWDGATWKRTEQDAEKQEV